MVQLAEKENCTGCMSCVTICHKKAITIQYDETGYGYPAIDSAICVNCGKCEKTCPELHDMNKNYPKECYAVWSLDQQTRKNSASGGAAAEFYNYALEQNWWICGAEYDSDFSVIHSLSRDAQNIKKYQQSKYVYSDISTVYVQIKTLLENDEKVICISLPCKIAGLLGYLGKPYENLLTVDIVCHGTPSEIDLKEHIFNMIGQENGAELKFREDNQFLFDLRKNNKSLYRKKGCRDTYLAAFLEGLNYRESCYRCKYATSKRISDITVCDFWGLGQEMPFEHPYTGSISAVLLNTSKGRMFFENCKNKFFFESRPVEEAIKGNAQLNKPTPIHSKRKEYFELYEKYGFEKAVSTCLKSVMREESKKQLKDVIKYTVRKSVKRLVGIFMPEYRG